MELVIDSNILFSFFWEKSFTKKLILDQDILLFAPDYALEEIKKYEKEIIHKTGITKKEFNGIREELGILVNFIPVKEYKTHFADALIFSPDKNDIDFFALCLKLKISLWTNDKLLKKQKVIQVLNTKDVIEKLIFEKE